MLQKGSRPVKPNVKMATKDLINRVLRIEPKGFYWIDGGYVGEISCKNAAPIIVKYQDWCKRIEDTDIALSKYGKLEKIQFKLYKKNEGYLLMYVDQGDRPSNVYNYPYIYFKRREKEQETSVEEPRRLWNERNSFKVSVKDIRNKMKAIPKTIRSGHQHLKDIFYDGVKLAVYSSDSREKFTEAKIALTEHEPMFETSIILTTRGSLCVIGRDGPTIYLGRGDFIYLKKI